LLQGEQSCSKETFAGEGRKFRMPIISNRNLNEVNQTMPFTIDSARCIFPNTLAADAVPATIARFNQLNTEDQLAWIWFARKSPPIVGGAISVSPSIRLTDTPAATPQPTIFHTPTLLHRPTPSHQQHEVLRRSIEPAPKSRRSTEEDWPGNHAP